MAVTPKFPKKLAQCADQLYELREARLKLQKQVTELETHEKALKQHIIEELPKIEASSVAGSVARVTLVPKTVPTVGDWDAVYRFVKKTGNFGLLQKRLNDALVKEYWDDGKKIPGVGQLEVTTLSINKV